jgi:hypothetical protein
MAKDQEKEFIIMVMVESGMDIGNLMYKMDQVNLQNMMDRLKM